MRQHGVRVLSARDQMLLRFVGEQYLVTLPQLAFLAGRSQRTARWLRTRWQRAGLADAGKLLVDEPTLLWLTRPGLAALGLPWKAVRPRYANAETWATLVDVRLAAAERYPRALWRSRRMLGHAQPVPSPLPDALLSMDGASVVIVAKPRTLDRRELERLLLPLIAEYEHTLLVLPTVSRPTAEWLAEMAGHASVIGYRRDPHAVTLPQLPSLFESAEWPTANPVEPCGVSPTSRHTGIS